MKLKIEVKNKNIIHIIHLALYIRFIKKLSSEAVLADYFHNTFEICKFYLN